MMHAVNTSCLPHLEGAYRMDAASRAHHPLALGVASPVLDQVGLCGLWGLQVHQMCVCGRTWRGFRARGTGGNPPIRKVGQPDRA